MERIYRQWIDEYQDQTWSLARYLLNDAREAEDVAQEAFIKLWTHRESVDTKRVRPWLMKVTRNICLDRLRKRRPVEEIAETHVSADSGPLERLQHSELGRWLQLAIARLGEPYRSLVVLRDVQQHSYEEVAGVTELSLPQVKTYLHRARKQLREQLSEVKG